MELQESPRSAYKTPFLEPGPVDAEVPEFAPTTSSFGRKRRRSGGWLTDGIPGGIFNVPTLSLAFIVVNTLLALIIVGMVSSSLKNCGKGSVRAEESIGVARETEKDETSTSSSTSGITNDDVATNASAPTPAAALNVVSDFAKEYAEEMRAVMEPRRDPCNDFYQYACGGWLEQTTVSPSEEKASRNYQGGEAADRNNEILKSILNEGKWPVLTEYYHSCMDLNHIRRNGIVHLEPLMNVVIAMSDALADANVNGFFVNLATIHAEGIPALFAVSVYADALNDPVLSAGKIQAGRSVYGGPSAISLPRPEYYLHEDYADVLDAFEDHVQLLLSMYSDEGGNALQGLRSRDAARKVLEFETELAKIIPEFYEGKENEDKDMMYSEMRNRYGWMGPYFDALYRILDIKMPPYNARMYTDSFFPKLLKLVDEADPDSMRAYLTYVVLRERAMYLKERFMDQHFKMYGSVLRGTQTGQTREDFCVDMTGGSNIYGLYTRDSSIGYLLGRYYVQEAFPKSSAEMVEDMFFRVKGAMGGMLSGISWLDASTMGYAIRKLQALTALIGSPEKPDALSKLTLDGSFYEMNVAIDKYDTARYMAPLGRAFDKKGWANTPQTVSAYNQISPNQIVIPAGEAQPPMFHPDLPPAVNYGTLSLSLSLS